MALFFATLSGEIFNHPGTIQQSGKHGMASEKSFRSPGEKAIQTSPENIYEVDDRTWPIVVGHLKYKKGGYAITDRGTFLAYQANVDLEILVESDPFLLNVYHVITVNPEKWPNVNLEGAKAFANFVTSPEGQKIIGEFGMDKYGQQLFIPDADKTDEELGLP